MKKLSLLEFKDYIGSISADTFTFSACNQNWHGFDDAVSFDLAFKQMIITFSPNTIFFKGKPNTLRLDRVKSVKVRETFCALGVVFTVICGDSATKIHDKEYTLIAQ